jgi:hypothetical protein
LQKSFFNWSHPANQQMNIKVKAIQNERKKNKEDNALVNFKMFIRKDCLNSGISCENARDQQLRNHAPDL